MSPGLQSLLLLHAAIAGFYFLWRLSVWWEGAAFRKTGARRWATLGRVFLIAALSAPLLCAVLDRLPAARQLLPDDPLVGRILGEADGPGDGAQPADDRLDPAVSENRRSRPIDGQAAFLAAWALGAAGLALFRARQWSRLRGLLAGAIAVRRVGSVEILIHPGILSPFATRVRGLATVLVPSFLVESGRWREAVRHELQHHRQGDPRWTLAWDALTVLLWVNPAIWRWRRRILELQELACDECLLGRGVNPAAYGEALLDVAEALAALPRARPGACCPALGGRESPALLARRLERILNPPSLRRSNMLRWMAWVLSGVVLWFAMAVAWSAGRDTDPTTPELQLQADLQKLTEVKLSAHLTRLAARRGVVVALDPATGAVLARAGFQRDEASHRMVAEESAPFTHQFPGASTLKTLVVAGALQARVVGLSDSFDTGDGALTIDGQTHHEWKNGGLGMVSPADVIVKSSNLGVIQIARRLGTERLVHFLAQLGLTAPEDAPVADLSCGNHSGLSVSAHQLAYAYAALVNGGRAPRSGETVIRPDVSDDIRRALVQAVAEGTGTRAQCSGFTAGGKTGTSIRAVDGAQTGTAYFVGFAPADAPRIVVSVIVDGLGSEVNGNRHAAPLFRDIVENGLPLLAQAAADRP